MKRPFTEIYKTLYKDSSSLAVAKKDKPKEKRFKQNKSLNMARSEKTIKKAKPSDEMTKNVFKTQDGTDHLKKSKSISKVSESNKSTALQT
jgi:hypothetical protein